MNVIKSISVRGFQSHENTACEFDSGITTIVGASDVGKSAILRALRWVALNSMGARGFDFLRWGSKEAEVCVEFDDGQKVVRKRSNSSNTYEVSSLSQEFEAVSSNVPGKVQELVRLGEDNFQGQCDAPFWISSSSGEVSRRLNQAIDLELIDLCLSLANSELRDCTARRDVLKDSVREKKAAFEAGRFLEEMQDEWRFIEACLEKIKSLQDFLDSLTSCVCDVSKSYKIIESSRGMFREFRCLESVGNACIAKKEEHDGLSTSIAACVKYQLSANVSLPKSMDVERLEKLQSDLANATSSSGLLGGMLDYVSKQTGVIKEISEELREVEGEFDKLMEGNCPLCQSPIR